MQLLEEADRSLHDALAVLSQTVIETRTTLGGGCAEMLMSVAVDKVAQKTEGKKVCPNKKKKNFVCVWMQH